MKNEFISRDVEFENLEDVFVKVPNLGSGSIWVQNYPLHVEVQFSCSFVSDSLWSYGVQHARPPCASPTPEACSDSCPSSWWCLPTISFPCHPLLLLPSIFPSIRIFSNESVICVRWPKYCSFSFSISPSNEHPGLISFRMDWLDLLAVPRDSQESSPTPQFKSINSSVLSL